MFKWEVYCCDMVTVEKSSHPPTHIRELTVVVYAETELAALIKAKNMVDPREHYQAISCEEELDPEAIE